jgi:beta-phosphoglucomutase-like phosphatase (HAD superfamily)
MPADQLQALIGDMDGTLIDSGAVVPDAFIATVQAISGRTFTREQVIDLYPVGPPALMLTRLLGRPCTAADLVQYHRRLRAMASTIQPYPEISSVLTMLHGRLRWRCSPAPAARRLTCCSRRPGCWSTSVWW